MVLVEPSREHYEPARALYNRSTARVPVGFPAMPDEFTRWMESRQTRLSYQVTRVLLSGGKVRGIIRWGIGGPQAKPADWYTVEPDDGVIESLFVEPQDLEGATYLAQFAVDDLISRGCSRVWAWEDEMGPPFYAGGFGQLSFSMTEVLQALTSSAFRVRCLELHLCLPRLEARSVRSPGLGFEVRTRRMPDGETSMDVRDGTGATVGQCVWASMAMKSDHPDARKVGYVWWLGIEEPFRARGAGRWLLELALAQMARNGHTRCVLTTASTNLRALCLYCSIGFQLCDTSTTLCLEL